LRDDILHLGLARTYPLDNLLALDLLEGVDLVQLGLEKIDELLLVFFGPRLPLGLGIARRGWSLEVSGESVLQAIVVNVMDLPIPDERGLELMSESVVEGRLAWCCCMPRA
jgi:hypothetical protein